MESIGIRKLESKDFQIIEDAFKEQGWNKPASQYEKYFMEQETGQRIVLIALKDNQFNGYVTVVWNSAYMNFRDKHIPEIVDLNVLIKFRRNGIANTLLDEAERLIKTRSNIGGIGVGLMSDYGNAQRIYVKRGYIPDGFGVFKDGRYLKYGDSVVIDDDIALYFTKVLS